MSEKTMDTLFKPVKWLAKIEFINRLLIVNNVLIAVFADSKGGKSSFISVLRDGLDCSTEFHALKVPEIFDETQFIDEMCCQFQQPATDLASLIQHINDQQASVLLVVDDAKYLSFAFLEKLLTEIKKQGANNYFHVCLLADFSLAESLNHLNKPFKNLIHSFELGGLTEEETKTWLFEKLPDSCRLTGEKIKEFYQLTGGDISKINAQLHDFFIEKKSVRMSVEKSRRKKLLGITTAMALGIMTSYWYAQMSDSKMPAPSQITALQEVLVHESLIPSLTDSAIIEHAELPPFSKIVSNDEDRESGMEQLAVVDKVVVAPRSMYRHRVIPPEMFISSLPAISSVLHKPTQIAEAKTQVSPEAGKDRYTIQVLASANKKTLQQFHASHPLGKITKILQAQKQGKNWYVLTLGKFATKKDAEKAMRQLPREIARLNPWIRPVTQLTDLG